jgi:hypothetical protein
MCNSCITATARLPGSHQQHKIIIKNGIVLQTDFVKFISDCQTCEEDKKTLEVLDCVSTIFIGHSWFIPCRRRCFWVELIFVSSII